MEGNTNTNSSSSVKKYTELSYLGTISKGNKEFTIRFLNTFINQLKTDVPKIQEHLEKKEWERLSAVAHKIKPSFQFIGAIKLQELVPVIESNARELIDLEKLPAMVAELAYISNGVIEELNEELQRLK